MPSDLAASSVVLTARFFDHKSAVLAVSELITAGTPQHDIHLSFEDDAAVSPTTAPPSLWSRMGNLWNGPNTHPVTTNRTAYPSQGKGATVTVKSDEYAEQARALLDQHGAYFV
ncbi:MAG: hypothetical protein ACRYFU_24900 [Janthinobacterium lividum]